MAASANQSAAPPKPFVTVAVRLAPGATFVELTLIDGGGLMVNGSAPEVPPPGAGVKTVICAVPAVATSAAVIAACSCVELTNVVVRSAPFHRTFDDDVKLLPLTVNVKADAPANVRSGAIDVAAGPGLNEVSTVTRGLVAARV